MVPQGHGFHEHPRNTARESIGQGRRVAFFMIGFMVGFPLQPQHSLAADRPNIIFILADDLGYGDLGCYGQKRIKTPRLDTLATQGVRFTQCYAGSTVCAPSRCVLMTGLHTGHCRVRGNALVPLLPEDVTVAEVLQQAGYYTGLIGKWGLGEPNSTGVPNKQGFDYWFGFLNQVHAHEHYPEYLWRNGVKETLPGKVGTDERYATEIFTREARKFLRTNKDKPFFLYLSYTVPHANNELGRDTGDGMEIPSYSPYDDQPWPQQEKGRAAMITRLDRHVGSIMDQLRELDLEKKTIVFFTSDNGPHNEGGSKAEFHKSSGPLRGIKRALYEGGIRVPMIVVGKDRFPGGRVCDYPCGFWDILPTLAELAGGAAPKPIDGHSIVPSLRGEHQAPPAPFYWEFHEGGFSQAVRWDNWKAVRLNTRAAPIQLYDLTKDVGESANVADEHPEEARHAAHLLQQARTDSVDFPIKERFAPGPKKQLKPRKK